MSKENGTDPGENHPLPSPPLPEPDPALSVQVQEGLDPSRLSNTSTADEQPPERR
jgi:hypothetical protein